MYLILYNPISRNGANTRVVEKLIKKMKKKNEKVKVKSLLDITDHKAFISSLDPNVKVIIVGGDGTLNRIANHVAGFDNLPELYLYKAGTGNDFRRSIKRNGKMIRIDHYLKKLPLVEYNEKKQYFLNGVGLGFDGLVCQLVEESRAKKTKRNFFQSVFEALRIYEKTDFEIEIDGVRQQYKDVWFASIMNSKYFGGGMKVAPKANRNSDELYAVIIHGISKAKIALLFPLIYLGWHTKIKGVTIISGKEIKVSSQVSTFMQIDGDVVENLNEITIRK